MGRIDTAQISGTQLNLLCMTFLDAVKAYYADPENMRRFNEWQAQRHAQPQEENNAGN